MEPPRVLFVDDEEELVSAVVERLQLRSIDAQGALSGEEALRMIETQAFDVVILDVKMPGLGGFDVIKRIKKLHPDMAVVFLTGHIAEEEVEAGMRMGAFEYLMKPVGVEALIEVVMRATEGADD